MWPRFYEEGTLVLIANFEKIIQKKFEKRSRLTVKKFELQSGNENIPLKKNDWKIQHLNSFEIFHVVQKNFKLI